MRLGNARPFLSQPLLAAYGHGKLTVAEGYLSAMLAADRKTDIIPGNGVMAYFRWRPEHFP